MFSKTSRLVLLTVALLVLAAPSTRVQCQMNAAPAAAPTEGPLGLVAREAVAALVPPSVFFAGKVASTQARNAAAVRLAGNALVVAALVDTGGYSTSVKESYQAYLITETALSIDGHPLPAGAYGCGFVAGDSFLVMDIGGHDLFTAHSTLDAALRRPTPLQMTPDGTQGDGYRLYVGRSYITLHPAK